MLTVILTHASLHTFVELADRSHRLVWYVEACEHHPQKLSVDGVICVLEVDEAHVHKDAPSLSELLQSGGRENC